MMQDAIEQFPQQLTWMPRMEGAEPPPFSRALVAGMGGSHIAADILLSWVPDLPVFIHTNYGIPEWCPPDTLVIASSYSGNTEETLDAYAAARARGMPVCAVATGGALLERAKNDGAPRIVIPDTGIQPRAAVGFSLKAMLRFMNRDDLSGALTAIGRVLDPAQYTSRGEACSRHLSGRIPLVYVADAYAALAHVWKIKLNEGAKVPAFDNTFPEVNHNEMTGFAGGHAGAKPETLSLFHCVVLHMSDDDPRIAKRMEITDRMYRERGIGVTHVDIPGSSRIERLMNGMLIADWTALFLAESSGADPEAVPMVEDFKRRMKE